MTSEVIYHWAVIKYTFLPTVDGGIVQLVTNKVCRIELRWSKKPPTKHKVWKMVRGRAVLCETKAHLHGTKGVTQDEAGDTIVHTFVFAGWATCEWRWMFAKGYVQASIAKIRSPIFKLHKTQPLITAYFYPDRNPETTSVDGIVYRSGTPYTWVSIRNWAGTGSGDAGTTNRIALVSTAYVSYPWQSLYRLIFLFDTSSILPGSFISEWRLRLWCFSKQNGGNWLHMNLAVFSSNPASNVALVPADYQRLGEIPLTNTIEYIDMVVNDYNTFINTPEAIGSITPGGITKLGLRLAFWDAGNVEPPWVSNKIAGFDFRMADWTGLIYAPRLQVTYTPP